MIDAVQVVLLVVIVVLTVILIILGYQAFLVLRDLRGTLARTNRVLDNAEKITETASESFESVSGILSGSLQISSIIKIVKSILKR